MAFRRKQAAPEPQVPEIVRVGREMAARDGLAFNVAQEAVGDWMKEFPEIAEAAGRSDQGATRPTRLMIEAFSSASAVRGAVDAGDSAEAIFNEQAAIAQEQASTTTKQWVVGLMQIRCIAVGYMLGALNQEQKAREFGDLFREFMAAGGTRGA